MSTLTVADNKGGKKPQYKDYVSFLETYRSGKKDDQCSITTNDSGVSFSLNNSSNNSSSSINSDLTDSSKTSFKDYLETYNNKKFSSVQPDFIKKQSKPPVGEKTVKTEVFIEISNPPNTANQVSKVIDLNNVHKPTSNVSKVSRIFEKNTQSNEVVVKTTQCNNKVNTFCFEQKEVDKSHTLKHEQKQTSIGAISKKFETNGTTSPPPVEHHKISLKKTPSIREKTRLFEDNHTNTEAKKKSPSKVVQQKNTSIGSVSPKPPINSTKPIILPKTFTETICITPKPLSPPPTLQPTTANTNQFAQPPPPSFQQTIVSNNLQFPPPPPPPFQQTTASNNLLLSPPPPPPFQQTPASNNLQFTPPPPPLFQQTASNNLQSAPPPPPPFQQTTASNNHQFSPPPPPPFQQTTVFTNSQFSPPKQTNGFPRSTQPSPSPPPLQNGGIPPPPPLPVNFATKKPPGRAGQKLVNGTSNGPTQNGRRDVVDGIPVPVVDKNDPRVKKLVYGALREMYGAYHDKANDYIATLPRNRVKKNNGLDSIIDSIASQGGLEKLNGRANPSVENE